MTSIQRRVSLALCAASISACAALPGARSEVINLQLHPGTPAHHGAQSDLQQQVQKQLDRHVRQTGACKVQTFQHGVGGKRQRRFDIECVGDSRYEAQLVSALRELSTPRLTHYRFIVSSPGWAQVMRWDRRIGRQTQFAVYEPGLQPQAISAGQHERVYLAASADPRVMPTTIQASPVSTGTPRSVQARAPMEEPPSASVPTKAEEAAETLGAQTTGAEMPPAPTTRQADDSRVRPITQADGTRERWFVKLAETKARPTNASVDLMGTPYAYTFRTPIGHALITPGFRTRNDAQAYIDQLPRQLHTNVLEIVSYQDLIYAIQG